MIHLKFQTTQELNPEIYIHLKNNAHSFVFACQNKLLLNYFESMPQNNNGIIVTLGHLFSHELVKFFAAKIEGGVFEVVEVSSSTIVENLACVDVLVNECENAKLYGTHQSVTAINKHILDKTVLTSVNKVTGYPILENNLKIDDNYIVRLNDNIRTLKNRMQFLKCSYLVENEVLEFYFTEKMVRHFCSLVLKNTNEKTLPFNILLGKIFSELFINYICTNAHIFAQPQSVELKYEKECNFLEFNLISSNNQFEFFANSKNKLFLIKLLTAMNFTVKEISSGKNTTPKLNHLNLPFAVELGVTYLNQSEYKNLTEGDIIVFDKTCLSTETMSVNKCVINLNGLNLVASLYGDSCQVTHFTKDW